MQNCTRTWSKTRPHKQCFLQDLLLFKWILKFVTLTFAKVQSVAVVCCLEIGQLNLSGGRSNSGPKPLTDSVPDHFSAAACHWKYVVHNGKAPKVRVATQAKNKALHGRGQSRHCCERHWAKRSISLLVVVCTLLARHTKTGTIWTTSTSSKLSQPRQLQPGYASRCFAVRQWHSV